MVSNLLPWSDRGPITTPATGATRRWAGWLVAVLLLTFSHLAQATHFRYGSITWRTVSTDLSKRSVEFKVSQAWRRSFYGTNVTVGSTINTGTLSFGNGASAVVNLKVTSVDVAGDTFYGEAIIPYTYPQAGSFTAQYNVCCRISTLANNADGNVNTRTLVQAGSGNNSPVSTLPPVVNLATGQAAATFQVAANDPDGDALQYTLATAADLGVSNFVNAPGLSINATTGLATFNTTNLAVDRLYNAVVKVSDGKTSILVDFLIKVTRISAAPQFDYSLTPTDGYVYQVAPGTPIAFSVRATDSDPGDVVQLQGIGLPPGAVMTPALPVSGNPVQASFSWTPTLATLGTSVISFVAQDAVGVQRTTSVTIQVSTKPVFDVPPTPAAGSHLHVVPGTPISQVVRASSIDPNSPVRLLSATGLPAAAQFAPALPTAAANPVSSTLNWTPAVADWGSHELTVTAANSYNDQKTHTFEYVVNSAPSFVSTPAQLNVVAGQPFRYDIVLTDPDLPYGDELEIEHPTLPAWLTLTDNHDGTGTLTGTPAVADAGDNPVSLVAADTYHHGMSYGLITQSFVINVIPCTAQALARNVALTLDANGQATLTAAQVDNGSTATCGIASLTVSPASFGCANLGPNPVTLTLTDTYGSVYTATATVTITDATLPTLVAPADLTVSADAGQCSASAVALGAPVAADNCSGVTVTNDAPAAFAKGSTTVTWTATDASGNTATATQVVTVNDTEKPVLTAPASLIVSADAGQCSASGVVLGSPVATDNCSGVTVTNDAPASFAKGSTTVTWTATDASGNTATATQTVTVNDTEKPVLTVPANLVVSAPADQCGAVVNFAATASDNCAGATVVASPASGSFFAVGTSTVTVTATDASGNVSTDRFTVTVQDVTAPAVATRAVSVALLNGVASVTPAQVNNGTTDACGVASMVLSRTSFDCAAIGANNVTLTVTDVHGNVSSAPAVVTVTGTIPVPTIVATPASTIVGNRPTIYIGYGSQSVTLTASGGVKYQWAAAPGLTNTSSAAALFTPTAEGMYTLTVTVTSASGCTATTSVRVYVEDVRCGNKNDKVQVCHNGHEICVAYSAMDAHIAHGDLIGSCTPPAKPLAATSSAAAATVLQAYPNPVADQATVTFRPAASASATVRVFDALGRQVAVLFDGTTQAGRTYSLTFDAKSLATGMYVCRYESQGQVQTQRLSVVK